MLRDDSLQIAPTGPYAKVQPPAPSAINQLEGASTARLSSEIAAVLKSAFYYPEPLAASPRFFSSGNAKPTHETFYGLAYVNEVGRPGFSRKPFAFPTGTMIVREKLRTLNADPERLVVMIKHERLFNPRANGWEFLTVSGDGTKVLKREKGGQCLKCHRDASTNDFVFPEDGHDR